MSVVEGFLADFKARNWDQPDCPPTIAPVALYLPAPGVKVEVAFAQSPSRPSAQDARRLWRTRSGGRATGVLLLAAYPAAQGARAVVVGLHDDARFRDVPLSHAERIIEKALDAHTTREAEQLLDELLAEDGDGGVPGLRNEGLFATHELEKNVPSRADWAQARTRASAVRGHEGEDLLRALGWSLTPHGADVILGSADMEHAVAVLLEGSEVFDRPSLRFGLGTSPVEHALMVAQQRRLTWVLAVQGPRVRLYTADPDTGIARKGSATFTELNLALLDDEHLAYAWLMLTPAALSPGGTVYAILERSADHAADLGTRLRERIYHDIVPNLAQTIATHLKDTTEQGLARAYHQTLVVLFRLLFVAYAEDRGLLPYRTNAVYTQRVALKTRARQYAADLAHGEIRFDRHATDLWKDLQAIWEAIRAGHIEWSVPAYGGSLFADDDETGKSIAGMTLTNAEIGPALENLLVDTGKDGTRGPVDFEALSVREFGTIYEGLLESSLSLAPSDLTVDPKSQAYLPAGPSDEVIVTAGSIYFHNASGARKATGSYFTKQFAVEHLLETALDPTLDEHLDRIRELLDSGNEASAADRFFDFRVADIAMGSGHFLVAAIDHIGVRMNAFLIECPIPAVVAELELLRAAAVAQLRAVGVTDEPQIGQMELLRRQIARRCIYGVDINEIAVDLARLAIWIHTFVPGLPMSSLGHGLVHGNSLTGIGTVDEALDLLEPDKAAGRGATSFFYDEMADGLAAGAAPLARAALLAEVNIAESTEADALRAEAENLVAETRRALDAAVAGRLGEIDLRLLTAQGWEAVVNAGCRPAVRDRLELLNVAHFPVAFPEIFRPGRKNPGFDVMLGNPPWEELVYEEIKFWTLRYPGLKGLKQKDQKLALDRYRSERPDLLHVVELEQAEADRVREALMVGPYAGMGAGHADLYKAFCWRFWTLLRIGGRSGIVLPRGALSAAGSAPWREAVLAAGSFADVTSLANTNRWVFEDVDGRYSLALVTLHKGEATSRTVTLRGPFHSRQAFDAAAVERGATFEAAAFATWSTGAAFPLLPDSRSGEVFLKYRQHPRFDDPRSSFMFKPLQGDFNATTHRAYYNADPDDATSWPVYAGASINLWNPDTGERYGYADSGEVLTILQQRRYRQARTSSSPYYGFPARVVNDPNTLSLMHPRIGFRDITNQTNTRTLITALMPGQVIAVNSLPFLVRARGTAADESYLLGVMSSIPMDWYARRYVELHVNFHILNAFPIPRPAADSSLRARVIEIAGRLAAVDGRFADWAAEVGVPVGSVTDPAAKDDLIAELDAVVGHLYGLSRGDLTHIFATFHRGWDYKPRLTAALAHFDRWTTSAEDDK